MNTLEKAELTSSVHDIERFSKPGIPIYKSKVPDMADRKARRRKRRRTQAFAKRYAFRASAENKNI